MYLNIKVPIEVDNELSSDDLILFEEHLHKLFLHMHNLLYINEARICNVARYRFLSPTITIKQDNE